MTATGTEKDRVAQTLEEFRPKLPPDVSLYRWEFGEDWTGDPIVKVYVVFKDQATEAKGFDRKALAIRGEIIQAVQDSGSSVFPHVRFRSLSGDRRSRHARG